MKLTQRVQVPFAGRHGPKARLEDERRTTVKMRFNSLLFNGKSPRCSYL